jgi:hypothetical protein
VSNTIINSWESQRKPGNPGEFVLFGLFAITSADRGYEWGTATATIGQRTKDGRLYQKIPSYKKEATKHLYYRKFVISREQAHIQIPALIKLAAAFNASPAEVWRLLPPGKPVASAKAWAEVYVAIGQGVGDE